MTGDTKLKERLDHLAWMEKGGIASSVKTFWGIHPCIPDATANLAEKMVLENCRNLEVQKWSREL